METNPVSMEQNLNSILVSVIVPVYNVVPYLGECLESICTQTYKNLEIILIDDGSKDRSGEICDGWAAKDSRIKVIHQENAGVSRARNAGLAACTGDLIGFVDADDWLDLEMYEKLVQCLTENNADAAMCGFVDYPHGAPVEKGLFPVPPCDFSGTVYQMMRRNGYFTSSWAKIFRRKLVYRDGNLICFDPSIAFGEDEIWLLEVLRNSRRTAFLPQALYYWRPRAGSVTRADTLSEKQMSIFRAKERSLSLLPDDASIRSLARGRIFNDCYSLFVQAYCSGDTQAICRIKRTLRPMRRDWLFSSNYIFMRKLKILAIEAEMLLHFPAGLVKKTYELTH